MVSPAIGVLAALNERGVPIDAVGGTSIGSLIAGGAARGLTPEELARQLKAAVVDSSPFDVTFPALSLGDRSSASPSASRSPPTASTSRTRGGNFFCVSTNLTTGSTEIHRSGPGWHAIRASFSIPGVFPPVRSANGDLLVDGGLLDNLPVGVMRGLHRGITVIAVDVGRSRDMVAGSLPDDGFVSGWRLLMGRFDRGAARDDRGPRASAHAPHRARAASATPTTATSTSVPPSTRTASPTSRRSTAWSSSAAKPVSAPSTNGAPPSTFWRRSATAVPDAKSEG